MQRRRLVDRRESLGRRIVRERRRTVVPVTVERRAGLERRTIAVRRTGADRRTARDRRRR